MTSQGSRRQRDDNGQVEDLSRSGKRMRTSAPTGSNEPRPGSLLRIHLENFMCHTNLVVNFGRNVNFIVGENGSGKSALLTALTVCFGTSARQTNRASSLKDFVKRGCSAALVSVTVRNESGEAGDEGFMPHKYGDSITVERRILASGSAPYTFRDHSGRKVQPSKEELPLLLDHLNIDVRNPISVMSQDASRSFLHSGRDQDKYRFFMRATLLEQVRDSIVTSEENTKAIAGLLVDRERDLPVQAQRLKQLQDQLGEAQAIDTLRLQEEMTLNKLAWNDVRQQEVEVRELEEMLSEEPPPPVEELEGGRVPAQERRKRWGMGPRALAKTKGELDGRSAECEAAHESKQRVLTDVQQSSLTMQQLSQTKQVAEQALQSSRRQVKKCETDRLQADNTVKNAEQRKESLQASVQRIRAAFQSQTQQVQDRRAEEQAAAEQKVAEAKAQLAEAERDSQDKQQRVRQHDQTAVRQAAAQESAAKQQIDQLTSVRQQLQQSSASDAAKFGGPKVPLLLAEIQKSARRFQALPVGPIGRLVSLRSSSWAAAVEVAVGKLLSAFVVQSFQDKQTLVQLAKQVGHHQLVVFVVRSLTPARYALPPAQLPPQHLTTVLSVLETQSDVVHNLLIDQGSIERVVLAEDEETAYQLGCKGNKQSNVKEVLTQDGTKYFRKGLSETVLQNKSRVAPRLGVDVSQQLQQNQMQIKEAEVQLRAAQEVKRQTGVELSALKASASAAQAARRAAAGKVGQAEAVKEEVMRDQQAAQSQAGDGDTTALEAEIAELDADMAAARERRELAEEQRIKADIQRQKCEKDVECERQRCSEAAEEADTLSKQLTHLTQQHTSLRAVVEDLEAKVRNVEAKMQARLEELEDKRTRLKQTIQTATQVCSEEEMEARGALADLPVEVSLLNRELEHIRKNIQKQQSRYGATSVEELQYQIEKQQKKYIRMKRNMEGVQKTLSGLEDAVAARKTRLFVVAKLVAKSVSHHFNHYMNQRGHTGRVKVSHEDGTLEMSLVMAGSGGGGEGGGGVRGGGGQGGKKDKQVSNTKTLSGGERSYSTLAFTLALGQENEAPFRAMDEFDVFMDAVNRRVGTRHLLEFAKANTDIQFIYLTPQDVSMLDKELGDDGFVHVQRMQNATR